MNGIVTTTALYIHYETFLITLGIATHFLNRTPLANTAWKAQTIEPHNLKIQPTQCLCFAFPAAAIWYSELRNDNRRYRRSEHCEKAVLRSLESYAHCSLLTDIPRAVNHVTENLRTATALHAGMLQYSLKTYCGFSLTTSVTL